MGGGLWTKLEVWLVSNIGWDVPKTHCQLWYLYNIDGRWRLYWRKCKRYLLKNQESADRIWERQNRIFMETFSRGQGSEQFNRNWCKESFLTVYLKMLVVKIGNKKCNTAGTKKKLSRVMYMEVTEWNIPIFGLSKDQQIWSSEVVNVQIARIRSSTLFLKSYFLHII